MTWKKSGVDYQFIEQNVKFYHLYIEKLKEMELDIILSTPIRDDNGGGKSNLPGRPTENLALTLIDDEAIRRMKKYVRAITFALDELDDEKKRFIERVFWKRQNRTMQAICAEFHISSITVGRWQRAFILRVGLLTGDIIDENGTQRGRYSPY